MSISSIHLNFFHFKERVIRGIVLASRASCLSFRHPNPQKSTFRTPNIFCEEFLEMSISSIHLNFFHLKERVVRDIVLSSRASCLSFRHPNPQKPPFRTPIFCEEFLEMSISSIHLNFFHFKERVIRGIVLASRASCLSFRHPNPQKSTFRTPNIFCEEFLEMSISSIHLNFFHLKERVVRDIVLSSRASCLSFRHPNPQKPPFRTPIFCEEFLEMSISSIHLNFFHLKARVVRDIVLASRVSRCHLDTQTLKNQPSGHPIFFVRNFLKCQFQAYSCFFFHLNIIPMALFMNIIPN